MKRCPQCNKVFDGQAGFCTDDGTKLIDEVFTLPSDFSPEDQEDDEQETVIRYKPKIDFDSAKRDIPNQPKLDNHTQAKPQVNQYAPNHGNSIAPQSPPKQNGGCLKYSLILAIGLIVGGGLVLGVLGFGYFYWNIQGNQSANLGNNDDKPTASSSTDKSNKTTRKKHSEPNSDIDESKLNGRIIKARGFLKSTPKASGTTIDQLPKNDRIEIIRRKSSSSKWYEIECEHGSKGWIDGYSIKFMEKSGE